MLRVGYGVLVYPMVMEFSTGSHRHGGLEEQIILEHSLARRFKLVQIGNIREDPNVLKGND